MKSYTITVGVSLDLQVEAETDEEAEELALEQANEMDGWTFEVIKVKSTEDVTNEPVPNDKYA